MKPYCSHIFSGWTNKKSLVFCLFIHGFRKKRDDFGRRKSSLFFLLFVWQKERSFAHFIFIKWVGGVCVKQIDTVLLSSHSFLLHFTINQVLWGTLQQNHYTKNCFYYCFIFHVALFWTFYSLVFYILYWQQSKFYYLLLKNWLVFFLFA